MLASARETLVCKTHLKCSVFKLHLATSSTLSNSTPVVVAQKIKKKSHNKFLFYCNSKISQHGRNRNIKESEAIFHRMSVRNVVSYTAMLTAYAQNGLIHRARKVFDEMPERTTASYNAMITAYVRSNGMVNEAFRLFREMGERNEVSYGAMISGFAQAGMFYEAEELFSEVQVKWRDPVCSNALISGYLKAGRLEEAVRVFQSMVVRDVVAWSSMIDGYCKKGRIGEAREMFDRLVERNVVTWTAMIDGYMNFGSFVDGFSLFLSMRRDVEAVNPTMMTVMLESCGRFERYWEGIQIHSYVLRSGFDFDVFLGNSIITMYCRFGCMDEANRMFQIMGTKDKVSWNSLIAGYIQCDKMEEACKFFNEMPVKDAVSWTTMISGFSNKGNVGISTQLFRMMPVKDGVAWTALISCLVTNGQHEDALHCFIEMLEKSVRPNSLTLSSILGASAGLATLNLGQQIHSHVLKMNMESDVAIQNSLVSMYSKCGNVTEAYCIFANISAPNVVSFNAMITGLAQNGLGEEALRLFNKMQKGFHRPNDITFLAVLSGCNHAGLVKEAWECFNLMKSVYGIEPRPDHYACLVDLLGRAGLLEKAVDLINSMPFQPHYGVWGALLGASKMHFRLDLAKLAAHHITKLKPDSATPYVVLSDLCSVAGKNKEAYQLRMAKKSKRIRKIPGCSWIILKDKFYLFLAGDQSIMNLENIQVMLQTVASDMSGFISMEGNL